MKDKIRTELGYRFLTIDKNPNKAGKYKMTVGSILEHENTESIMLYPENLKEIKDSLSTIKFLD
jgi:hypothetical protein